jgi:hypothetical protein
MEVKIETGTYNPRRYGNPWIAKASFGPDGKPAYEFGSWIGRPGEAGVLRIEAEPGDVIARGQRDRGGAGDTEYNVLQEDGTLGPALTRAEAWEHDTARQAKPSDSPLANYTTADLVAELRRRGINVQADGEQ